MLFLPPNQQHESTEGTKKVVLLVLAQSGCPGKKVAKRVFSSCDVVWTAAEAPASETNQNGADSDEDESDEEDAEDTTRSDAQPTGFYYRPHVDDEADDDGSDDDAPDTTRCVTARG